MNVGSKIWATGRIRLAYHWRRAGEPRSIQRGGVRTDLDEDVPPGQVVSLAATVQVPGDPGRYLLEWDAVEEGVSWLSATGVVPFVQHVTVYDPLIITATIDDLPTAITASQSVDLRIQARGPRDGLEPPKIKTFSLRWIRPDGESEDAHAAIVDHTAATDGSPAHLSLLVRAIAPPRPGLHRLALGRSLPDGSWHSVKTEGGSTQVLPRAWESVVSNVAADPGEIVDNSDGDRIAVDEPVDWQYRSEEAEYFRARMRRLNVELDMLLDGERERSAALRTKLDQEHARLENERRIVEGYRRGRVMRLLNGLRRLLRREMGRS
jgi:hypothetical protein